MLTRKLASAGHYPSIDVLESKSRVKDAVTTAEQQQAALRFLRCEASYREKEDLVMVGAYHKGSDAMVDAAIQLRDPILGFLRQPPSEHTSMSDTWRQLRDISTRIDASSRRVA